MTDLTGQQIGKYRIIRLLGEGGFADVYLGEHIHLNTQAAIKLLRTHLTGESEEHSFQLEGRTVAHLQHPHIVRILDFGIEGSKPFLVMTYAPYGTLRQRHRKGSRLSFETISSYVNQIAGALQYAHDQKVVHRDIKPENMLLGHQENILLSDFGIALILQSTKLQSLQEVAGTVAYMAPEQLLGQPRPASDQYALGIVVYEWLCGERPFEGSFMEVASQQMFAPPPSLLNRVPNLPPEVEQVVSTALAKEPSQRFASIRAFANALSQSLVPASSISSSSTPTPSQSPISTGQSETPQYSPPSEKNASDPGLTHQKPSSFPQYAQSSPNAMPTTSSTSPSSTEMAITGSDQIPLPQSSPFTGPTQIQSSPSTVINATRRVPSLVHSIPARVRQQDKNKLRRNALLIALLLVLLSSSLIYLLITLRRTPHVTYPGIGVTQLSNGEYIGISDGAFAFDTNRPDGDLKLQAADKLKMGDTEGAKELWQNAIMKESNDAEALIYLENQRILDSGHPYITFVVGALLSASLNSTGRDTLQGAYVAQKEYNDASKLPGGVQVRLLVLNAGSSPANTVPLALQIVQAARADASIVGVIGWPFTTSSRDAITQLASAHIPMVSATATDDFLTGISPYFFRVIASNNRQAAIGAIYAEQQFHAKRAALFVDPTDAYSQELATDFNRQFTGDGNTVVAMENYTVGQVTTFSGLLQNALLARPDLIYFAGYAGDADLLLASLPTSGPFMHIQVIGGNALYGQYSKSPQVNLSRLHFTTMVDVSSWDFFGLPVFKPAFFSEYPLDFDPNRQHPGVYSYSRVDNVVILTYDAALALLHGSSIALVPGKTGVSSSEVQQGLTHVTGPQEFQGVSGQISFGSDGDSINKAIVLLNLTPNGDTRIESVQGAFLANS